MKKRFWSLLLAAAMAVTMLPGAALTASAEEAGQEEWSGWGAAGDWTAPAEAVEPAAEETAAAELTEEEPSLTAAEDQLITEIVLPGDLLPFGGDTVADRSTVQIPEGAPYTLKEVIWYDLTNWSSAGGPARPMAETETFTAGKMVGLSILLAPKEGYTFSEGIMTTIEGLTYGAQYTMPFGGGFIMTYDGVRCCNVSPMIMTQFTDVTRPSAYYYHAVYTAANNGWVNGYADGTFRPSGTCNRAQIVTFLWRFMGWPEATGSYPFNDPTNNNEFNTAITWAAENGIATGYDSGKYDPWAPCHRAAIVTFLWRYAGRPEPASTAEFSDMPSNPDFIKAISWAVENGIVTGYDDGTFRPWAPCNRAQTVTFLYRYLQRVWG